MAVIWRRWRPCGPTKGPLVSLALPSLCKTSVTLFTPLRPYPLYYLHKRTKHSGLERDPLVVHPEPLSAVGIPRVRERTIKTNPLSPCDAKGTVRHSIPYVGMDGTMNPPPRLPTREVDPGARPVCLDQPPSRPGGKKEQGRPLLVDLLPVIYERKNKNIPFCFPSST